MRCIPWWAVDCPSSYNSLHRPKNLGWMAASMMYWQRKPRVQILFGYTLSTTGWLHISIYIYIYMYNIVRMHIYWLCWSVCTDKFAFLLLYMWMYPSMWSFVLLLFNYLLKGSMDLSWWRLNTEKGLALQRTRCQNLWVPQNWSVLVCWRVIFTNL